MRRTLLVNYWYAHPVGHAIEALRFCLGYHAADPTLRISLALNGATPTELADWCPFVERTYAVPYTDLLGRAGDPVAALAGVPRDWDYVLDDARSQQPEQQRFAGLRAYYTAARAHFRPHVARGVAGAEPPEYTPHQRLWLELPLARDVPGVGIAVLPAGSGEAWRYPSAESWEVILRRLAEEFPEAVFCLLGKTRRDGRTSTAFDDFERLARAVPRSVDGVDVPLADQLALVEACRVFLAPHTGFGTAALAVGTPWLAIAGGPWHEYFCNGVPFVSVQPDTSRFPAYTWFDAGLLVDDDGAPRTPSMTRTRIEEDLDELVDGARLLIDGRLPYDQAVRRHFQALLAAYRGDRSRIFSFDAIHELYI